uniref:Uncharacterized protein n=1 Tax=Acrobeloides nanus TaxID=290746 RepID=A0A914EH97_9BILA
MSLLSTKYILLLISIVLILIGIGLSLAGTLSAAWQVVDLTEFGVEHEHGLWIDCARSIRPNMDSPQPVVDYSLHCMYKFDDSADRVVNDMLWNYDVDEGEKEEEGVVVPKVEGK